LEPLVLFLLELDPSVYLLFEQLVLSRSASAFPCRVFFAFVSNKFLPSGFMTAPDGLKMLLQIGG
jgi:hypothetical protein